MKRIIFVAVLIISAILYAGCKDASIQFNRESSASRVMNSIREESGKKDVLKKSSGIIIYKDNTSQNQNKKYNNPQFGPKDLDFDIKFK